MALESATKITDLVVTNPSAGDPVSQGDDHIRLIKTALRGTPLVVDRVYAEYTANADLTTVIPFDDTIPQSTEGTQILSVSITPKANTSRLRVRFQGCGSVSAQNDVMMAALFVGASANAAAASFGSAAPVAGSLVSTVLEYEFVPGSTAAQTLAVRVGPSTGTLRLNGTTSARRFGGTARATLIVEEIQV